MGYRVHRLGSGQVDRKAIRRTRRILAAGVDTSQDRMLRKASGQGNETLEHFRHHIMNSMSGKPLMSPHDTSTDAFLRSMSGMNMVVDHRPSADNSGGLDDSMPGLSAVFPWMYQVNILLMQAMLASSMIAVGVIPESADDMRDALSDSWMGDGGASTVMNNLCSALVAPISATLRKSVGGPPVNSRADLDFLMNMDSEEALDYMVGTMFIADMAFNHF